MYYYIKRQKNKPVIAGWPTQFFSGYLSNQNNALLNYDVFTLPNEGSYILSFLLKMLTLLKNEALASMHQI